MPKTEFEPGGAELEALDGLRDEAAQLQCAVEEPPELGQGLDIEQRVGGAGDQVIAGAAGLNLAVQPGRTKGGLAGLGTREHADEAGGAIPGLLLAGVEVDLQGAIRVWLIERFGRWHRKWRKRSVNLFFSGRYRQGD